MNNLNYITYQTFPADTANSIQTIANIKYLIKEGMNISLYFPLRDKTSSADSIKLKEFYSIKENFTVVGSKHNLPFGKINIFNRVLFLYSHLVWSYSITNKLTKEIPSSESFLTRSDWVFFFLSRKNRKVTFECHQYNRIRKFLISKSLKKETSKIIFLNKNLKEDYEKKYKLKNNYTILHNGVDLEYYPSAEKEKNYEIVFIGKLKRFDQSRNIDFLLKGLTLLDERYTLKIVGANESEIVELNEKSKNLGLEGRVKILKRVGYSDVAKQLSSSSIGILINSNMNKHSTLYTSPLKYFEYLAARLKVIAVDFPSHRDLPFSDKITFFQDGNIESLAAAINEVDYLDYLDPDIFPYISLETRAKKIIDFLSY